MNSPHGQRSGAEIQQRLRAFVQRWQDYAGGEREEAQTFLNQLIDCYGVDRLAAGVRFEHHLSHGGGFVDMFWPGRVLVEMKAPSHSPRLEDAQPQAERYWRSSAAPDRSYPMVRYVVLCSFRRILVWDMHQDASRPAVNLALDELVEHYEALLFLAGEHVEASYVEHHRALTQDAAEAVALLYQSLQDRGAASPDEIQRFTMQCVWTMFAEDLAMIGGYPLQRIVARLRREAEPNAARDLGYLFRVLNQKGDRHRTGELAQTHYVNGELFGSRTARARSRVEGPHPRTGRGPRPARASRAVAVRAAGQHAGHRHRAHRRAHCPGHAVDGAPADDRPLWRG